MEPDLKHNGHVEGNTLGMADERLGTHQLSAVSMPMLLHRRKSLRTRVLSNHIASLTYSDPEPERN